jgi:hypothetical protein
MAKRLLLISGPIAMGLLLNGRSKCGPIWDDWMPKSCKLDNL